MKLSSTKTHGILPGRYAQRKSPEWQTAPTPTACPAWCTVRIVVLEWDISVPKQIIAKRTMIQIPLSNAAIIGARAAYLRYEKAFERIVSGCPAEDCEYGMEYNEEWEDDEYDPDEV